jgi:hypothetical protein
MRAYKLKMSTAGVWGDEMEIVAISKAFNVTIRVFHGELEV